MTRPMERFSYGTLGGEGVAGFRLFGDRGLSITLMSYGARITELLVPDRSGALADIVLGFDSLADYVASDAYHGAICGRYGNRIGGGRFRLGETEWQISRNDGANHLHGGFQGFDRKNWRAVPDAAMNAVRFIAVSPHGEEGFPGTLTIAVTYRLLSNRLMLSYEATSDRDTVVSMINHSYFNLAGAGQGDICGHELTLNSDFYLPTDNDVIPTGEMRSTVGTKFDFSKPKPIGRDMAIAEPGKAGYRNEAANLGGYDNTWVLAADGATRWAARVVEPKSGRGFELATTEPSIQFYTASYLDDPTPGKGGIPYGRYSGLTLEPQKMPDAPNRLHFPSAVVKSGGLYHSQQVYQFY